MKGRRHRDQGGIVEEKRGCGEVCGAFACGVGRWKEEGAMLRLRLLIDGWMDGCILFCS